MMLCNFEKKKSERAFRTTWEYHNFIFFHNCILAFDSLDILPILQRMPFTFMAFPSGGQTPTGFDIEYMTKSAAIETNRVINNHCL